MGYRTHLGWLGRRYDGGAIRCEGLHGQGSQGAVIVRWRIWQHVAAMATALIVAAIVVWARLPPIDVVESRVETLAVGPGDMLVIKRKVKWLRSDCTEATVSAAMVDSLGFHHTLEAKHLGVPNAAASTEREWPVPYTMPWGQATYRSTLQFTCPPLFEAWPITVALPELKFTVRHP
jgi:hypothetical protein